MSTSSSDSQSLTRSDNQVEPVQRGAYKSTARRAAPDLGFEERRRPPGQSAALHIKHMQLYHEATVIPDSTFQRLVRATFRHVLGVNQDSKSKRVAKLAFPLLQNAAQTMLVYLLRDAQILATHAKRPTIMARDIIMAIRMNPHYQRLFLSEDDHGLFSAEAIGGGRRDVWSNMAERTESGRIRIKPDIVPAVRAAKNARSMDVHLYTGQQKDNIRALKTKDKKAADVSHLDSAVRSSKTVFETSACKRAKAKGTAIGADKVLDRAASECRRAAMSKSEHVRDQRLVKLQRRTSDNKPKQKSYQKMQSKIQPCGKKMTNAKCKQILTDDDSSDGSSGDASDA